MKDRNKDNKMTKAGKIKKTGQRIFKKEVLEKFCSEAFEKIGVKKEVYHPVIEGLIETSLRGVDSHGVRLFSHYLKCTLSSRINKNPDFRFKQTSNGTCILDADDSYGITASKLAMEKAVELAKKNGVGVVSVINSTHFGAAAIYALMAAKKDMIGFAFTHTDSFVVPFGGKRPFLGTNAICFAAPCKGEEPFCLDMATSAASVNKIRMYREEKKELEPEWVVDKDGNPTTNPSAESYLVHFGGYKGYGVAMMVEILCSILTGMNFGPYITPMFSDFDKKRKLGHFMMAIDISKFQDVKVFKERLKKLMDSARSQPHNKDVKGVMVANDPQKEAFRQRSKSGIPLSGPDYKSFTEIADLLHIKMI